MYSYACKSLVPTVAVPETSIFLCKGNVIGMHMFMCIHFYTQLYVYFCRGIFHFSLWQAARVAASRKVIHQFNKFLLNDYDNIIIIFEASIYIYLYIYNINITTTTIFVFRSKCDHLPKSNFLYTCSESTPIANKEYFIKCNWNNITVV